jgi:hypothetical protein
MLLETSEESHSCSEIVFFVICPKDWVVFVTFFFFDRGVAFVLHLPSLLFFLCQIAFPHSYFSAYFNGKP